MIVKGEYLFKTFEEAKAFVKEPTNYEKKNGLTIEPMKTLIDTDDLKLLTRKSSDGTDTIFLFFKNSTKYDIWKFWCMSEKQMILLQAVLPFAQYIEYKNSKESLFSQYLDRKRFS